MTCYYVTNGRKVIARRGVLNRILMVALEL